MVKIDLNCDLGESFGRYNIGADQELIKHVSSVNVACGWHAGDPLVMEKTVAAAKQHNVAVGAHPGFQDLMGFGRRNMRITPEEAKAYIKYQVGALMAFLKPEGMELQHVKPHGALYNMSCADYELATAVCKGVCEISKDIIILALPNSMLERAAGEMGLGFACEVFADRAYTDEGTLVPRGEEGAVITDPEKIAVRAIKMIEDSKVISINGREIQLKADSICVHGDNMEALTLIKRLRQRLAQSHIEIAPLDRIVGK